jgi:hypothetical protein
MVDKHRAERAFYDMSGEENIYKYINTEGKRTGKLTALEYLQKNTGVFNGNGIISKDEIEKMKQRAQTGNKNIWHGFISLNEEMSYKIDTPSKCIDLIKRNFGQFFKDMGLEPKGLDLMCALHMDRPTHLHIHFVFWEKAPTMKYRQKELQYRHKGKISKEVIDNMHVRLNRYVDDDRHRIPLTRTEALYDLKKSIRCGIIMSLDEDIKKEIKKLLRAVPRNASFEYNSMDMKPHRPQVDKIVGLLLKTNKQARQADNRFYQELGKIKEQVESICRGRSTGNVRYHYNMDESKINVADKIEADYKRKQGNIVLNAIKQMKPNFYERNPKWKYKVNDETLKRRIRISEQAIVKAFKSLLSSFGGGSELLERDFANRLEQIEAEIAIEKEKEEQSNIKNYYSKR